MENEFLQNIFKKYSLLVKKKQPSFKEMNDKVTKIMLKEFGKEESPNIFDIIEGLMNRENKSKENKFQSIFVCNFLLRIVKMEESKVNKKLILPLLQSYVYFKANQEMDLEFKLIYCSFLIDISKKTREFTPEIYYIFNQILNELISLHTQTKIKEEFELNDADYYKHFLDLLWKKEKLDINDIFLSSLNFVIKLIEINYAIANRDINFDILHRDLIEKLQKLKVALGKKQVLVEPIIEKLHQTSIETELKPELEILKEKAIYKIKQLTPRIDYEKKTDKTLDMKKKIKKLKNENKLQAKKLKNEVKKNTKDDISYQNKLKEKISEKKDKNYKRFLNIMSEQQKEIKKMETTQLQHKKRSKRKGKRMAGNKMEKH